MAWLHVQEGERGRERDQKDNEGEEMEGRRRGEWGRVEEQEGEKRIEGRRGRETKWQRKYNTQHGTKHNSNMTVWSSGFCLCQMSESVEGE